MPALQFFDAFWGDLAHGVHDLENDDIQFYLSNATPSASADAVKADLAEISTGNGYSGPISTAVTYNHTTDTVTIELTDKTITATGAVGPFQYIVLMNNTAASDPLIGYVDHGSAVTLANGETHDIDVQGATITIGPPA